MRYIGTILLILTCFSGAVEAKQWSLEDCMKYAVENSYKRLRQDQQNKIIAHNYTEAIAILLPSVNANSNLGLNYGRGLGDDNTYVDVNSLSNSYGLSTNLTLFNGFTNINRIRLHKVNKLLGTQQLQEVKDVIALETMEAYYNVLYYIEMQKLMENKLSESRKELAKVKKEEEVGLKGFPDVAEIMAKEASDNYNLTRQKNIFKIAVIKLKEKMNYPLDEELQLEQYQHLSLVVKSTDAPQDIFDQSKTHHPKALIADSRLKAQDITLQVARGSYFPRLSFGAGISSSFYRSMGMTEQQQANFIPFGDQLREKLSKSMSFNLSIPLFNGLSNRLRVQRSKAELAIQEIDYNESMRQLYSEIEQAVADMDGKADECYYAEKQLNAMEIAHKVNKRKYEEGLVDALILSTSANRLLQAEVDFLNANIMYRQQHKLVNYYKGEPFVK